MHTTLLGNTAVPNGYTGETAACWLLRQDDGDLVMVVLTKEGHHLSWSVPADCAGQTLQHCQIAKQRAVKIELSGEVAEGVHTFTNFQDAELQLHLWAEHAPPGGGYDKCHFQVTFADGFVLQSRLDLVHSSRRRGGLRDHILLEQRYVAGLHCPPHLSQAVYQASVVPRFRAQALSFLACYEVGDG